MVMTDPIADMLTRMRNAIAVRKDFILVPSSKLKVSIVDIMKKEGFIKDYDVIDDGKSGIIRIEFRYYSNKVPVIRGLKRISRPGKRVYAKHEQIPRVLAGTGITILSTPRGVMSGNEAKKKGVGGELICKIW